MMADSGARGSDKQIKQLAGMRGLMADTTGHTIELPIKSNFREGLDVLEYFMSAHGARKVCPTRSAYGRFRLPDPPYGGCFSGSDHSGDRLPQGRGRDPGHVCGGICGRKEEIESLQERITGRFSCETITDKDGNVIVKANHMITPKRAARIIQEGVDANGNPLTKVKIRTILTCRSRIGICAKCYGANMAHWRGSPGRRVCRNYRSPVYR